ncbi:MAG TPA: porin family protein [Flavisolibacter sp.]
MNCKMMLLSTAGLLSMGAFAQSQTQTAGRTTIGITAGVNWNNINGKAATGGDLDNKLKTGFNGGINVEFPVSNGFYVQPGVEFRRKGSELSNGNKLSLSYIDVPVTFLYKPALGTGSMLLGFGPYVGFGVGGKVTSPNGVEREVSFDNTWSASEAEDLQFRKLDAGANFMAGYEFRSKLSASVKAQLGLIDINHDTNIPGDETRYRNTGFGLSLGYRL